MSDDQHVLLIQASNDSVFRQTYKAHYVMPPIGLLYIASTLQIHGYSVTVVNLTTRDYSAEALAAELRRACEAPLAVGLSMYTETAEAALQLACFVRELFPKAAIIAGGPHATFCDEEILECADVDFVVHGEGESTLLVLLEAIRHPGLPLQEIAGISFRDANGRVTRTAPRGDNTLLDLLPLPAYGLEGLDETRNVLRVVSSRGCPGRCIFCASRAYSGPRYRMHSAEWLFSLVVYSYVNRPFALLDLLDDTFTANRRRTKRFCALLRASGLRLSLQIKSRADFIREDVVRELSTAGCKAIHIGVESADQDVLNAISKGTTLEQIYSAIALLVRYGIRVNSSFIIGNPTDTPLSIERTLILAAVVKDFGSSAVSFATPFPGTPLCHDAERLGLRIAVTNWRKYDTATPIFATDRFAINDLRRAYSVFVSSDQNIRGRTLITGNLHSEFWNFLDAWKATLRPGEGLAAHMLATSSEPPSEHKADRESAPGEGRC